MMSAENSSLFKSEEGRMNWKDLAERLQGNIFSCIFYFIILLIIHITNQSKFTKCYLSLTFSPLDTVERINENIP